MVRMSFWHHEDTVIPQSSVNEPKYRHYRLFIIQIITKDNIEDQCSKYDEDELL